MSLASVKLVSAKLNWDLPNRAFHAKLTPLVLQMSRSQSVITVSHASWELCSIKPWLKGADFDILERWTTRPNFRIDIILAFNFLPTPSLVRFTFNPG